VKGFGRESFRVFEDDREREVTHFIGADSERELVVAVDMSGSMGPSMATCREAVRRFLGSLRPVDHVTLLAFNDTVFTVARRDATAQVGSGRWGACARGEHGVLRRRAAGLDL
jgi:Mg-chelatase subunit ChlD